MHQKLREVRHKSRFYTARALHRSAPREPTPMSSTQEKPQDKSPDLTQLHDTYDIIGEIGGHGTVRLYPARRKDDGRDVLVTVMRSGGDVAQGKAIAQFAADVNLLTTLRHPNVPQVLEGRWVGEDAFALVTDRIQGTSL